MKKLVCLALFCTLTLNMFAQIRTETKTEKIERMQWWTEARFGMFIHWGLYALPARHEWVMSNENMSKKTYEKYANYFNPDLYDPTEWAQLAKKAGMKYVVFTAKHHDGFSMYDSKYTDYKVTNTMTDGTVGIFSTNPEHTFVIQLTGVACYAVFCLATSFLIIFTLKKTVGIRVSEKEELEGLDSHEHGMNAYSDFRLNDH